MSAKRLADLAPRFLDAGDQPGRRGMAISMDCPCGKCGERLCVPFEIALDGHVTDYGQRGWQRTGDTFETLSLTPSILRPKPHHCGWHGYLTDGELRPCPDST